MKPSLKVINLALAEGAKDLCSAVFVSERDPEAFIEHVDFKALRERPDYTIDRTAKAVTLTLGESVREARFYGDQGCTIIPLGADDVFFEPVPVKTTLPEPQTQLWPNPQNGA